MKIRFFAQYPFSLVEEMALKKINVSSRVEMMIFLTHIGLKPAAYIKIKPFENESSLVA